MTWNGWHHPLADTRATDEVVTVRSVRSAKKISCWRCSLQRRIRSRRGLLDRTRARATGSANPAHGVNTARAAQVASAIRLNARPEPDAARAPYEGRTERSIITVR